MRATASRHLRFWMMPLAAAVLGLGLGGCVYGPPAPVAYAPAPGYDYAPAPYYYYPPYYAYSPYYYPAPAYYPPVVGSVGFFFGGGGHHHWR